MTIGLPQAQFAEVHTIGAPPFAGKRGYPPIWRDLTGRSANGKYGEVWNSRKPIARFRPLGPLARRYGLGGGVRGPTERCSHPATRPFLMSTTNPEDRPTDADVLHRLKL